MGMTMGAQRIELPPGLFLRPTDRQAIDFFLKPKVLGQPLLLDVVKNVQVYGPHSDPWKVFDPDDQDSWFDSADKETEKIRLVFTKLSPTSTIPNKKKNRKDNVRMRENTSKKAGCGTWVTKGKPEPIEDRDGNVIGVKRYLVFDIKDTDSAVGKFRCGSFRMHEYCLSGINERFDPAGTLVLCKITYESSKNLVRHEIADLVGAKPNQKEEQDNDLEGPATSTLTETNLDGSVGGNHVGVQDINEFGKDFFLDDQGGDFSSHENLCLDEDWISELLNSIPEEELVQDTTSITSLGKRKLEAESSCGTKKLCLG